MKLVILFLLAQIPIFYLFFYKPMLLIAIGQIALLFFMIILFSVMWSNKTVSNSEESDKT